MKTSAELDYYGILGVSPFATQSEIRTAYHKIALACQPAKSLNDDHIYYHEKANKVDYSPFIIFTLLPTDKFFRSPKHIKSSPIP